MGIVRARSWRAAHDGLEGDAIDPREGGVKPTGLLLDDLVRWLTPALAEHGDLGVVTELLDRLRADGCGATRQRRAAARRGVLSDVTALVHEQTVRA